VSTGALDQQRGPITYELATWGVRAVAFLIDLAVFVGIAVVLAFGIVVVEGADTDEARELARQLSWTIMLPLWLLYAPLLMIRGEERNGQTLGKQAMGIRVVRENGAPVTLGNAILRETLGRQLVAMFTYGLYFVVDSLWPLWDRSRQCLHDKVAQTRVVRLEPLPGRPGGTFAVGEAPERSSAWPQPATGARPAGDLPPAAVDAPDVEPAPQREPEPVPAPAVRTPIPPPPPRDDSPVRDGWLPPHADR
jgi:uncharacterized RDD family membrane protein YckC